MSGFHNLKVGSKLIGGFLIVALIGAIIGIQGIWQAAKINAMAETMYERETSGIIHMAEANLRMMGAGRAIRSALLTYNQQESEQFLKERRAGMDKVYQELEAVRAHFVTGDGQRLLVQAIEAVKTFDQGLNQVEAKLRKEELDDPREATDLLLGDVRPLGEKAGALLG